VKASLYAVLGIWALLEWRIRLRSRLDRRGARRDPSMLAVIAFVSGGLAGGFVLAAHVHGAAMGAARRPLFGVGLALMCAGIALRQWAIAVLGRYFTVDVRVQEGQTVVDRGPYRWVRHPSYTGLILVFVGLGLALGNWASLVVVAVVPAIGIVIRIRYEERTLLAGLGEPYRRYAESRPRLFPGIW
jgi:protein-S-isoprenylcysteine O-methyltransferase Ste14